MVRWIVLVGMMFTQLYGEVVQQDAESSILYGVVGAEGLHAQFAQHLKIEPNQKHLIGYLEFKENYPISESTYLYVKYALEEFKKNQVLFVIVHLNSFGGELVPTIKIVDLFQKFDVNEGIPLIAFIDRHAIASSSMIVYACRFIAISKEAVMGGALKQVGAHPKVWNAPATFLPYLLNEYASLASLYGRDPALAEAMVDPSIILVKRQSKLIKVDSLQDVDSTDATADVVFSAENDLLTLNAMELLQYGIADFEIVAEEGFYPSHKQKEEGSWPFHLSLLSKEPYLGAIPDATVMAYHHWTISLLLFLTHPAIGAIFVVGVIVAFYVQIKSKRLNFAGAIGLVCLALLILISCALQSISWIDIIFLGLGVTLIVLDSARKVAGGGIVGFLGIGVTMVSLIMLMLPGFEKFTLLDFESSSFVARSLLERVIWLVSALAVAWSLIFAIKKRFIPHMQPLPKASVMISEAAKESDFLEKFEESALPKEGSEGIAHCSLRPLGKVMIRDRIYEAVSDDGKMILKKSHIIVVKHHLGKLVVRQSDPMGS